MSTALEVITLDEATPGEECPLHVPAQDDAL